MGKGQSPHAKLNNFSDFFGKNGNFYDFKEDCTFRFSDQFEKKVL